jgi:hypothetical protein
MTFPEDFEDISSNVARLFERDFSLHEETHVAHRLGSLEQPFSLLISCEGVRCIYRIFYDPGWPKGGVNVDHDALIQFLKPHVASNTEHVRLVFNIVSFATTEEDGRLDGLWEQVNAVPARQILLVEFQEASNFQVDDKFCEMFLVRLLDEACYSLVGIDYDLLMPYRSLRQKLRFELVKTGEQKSAVIRVLYQETNDVLAVLSPLTVFKISVEDYNNHIKGVGYIWGEQIGTIVHLYAPREKDSHNK